MRLLWQGKWWSARSLNSFSCYTCPSVMPYRYDRRPVTANTKAQEHLEGLMGMCAEAVTEIGEGLLEDLGKVSEVSDDPLELAQDIVGNLRIAGGEGAEKLSDVVGCIRDIKAAIPKLEKAMSDAKREARSEGNQVALDALDEAADAIRALKRELKSIEAESVDVPD